MKKMILGFVVVVMASCSSTPFKANVDNELLVGEWKISKVDDSAALISTEEFLITAMHNKYKEGYSLNFEEGPKFSLLAEDGSEIAKGNYSIGANNKSVTIQLLPAEIEISYDIELNNGAYNLTVTTPGELVNLTIEKE
jgi:hypothetical protein